MLTHRALFALSELPVAHAKRLITADNYRGMRPAGIDIAHAYTHGDRSTHGEAFGEVILRSEQLDRGSMAGEKMEI